jgi:sucrose phosphorylase
MVEPDVDEFLAWARSVAAPLKLELLTEVHAPRPLQHRLATTGCWVYDFVLPGLMLHAFATGDAGRLAEHLAASPDRQVTTLDSHDGIPVQPDLEGILTTDEAKAIVADALARGANLSRLYTTAHLPDPGFDAHQINATYRCAIGDDEAFVAARAIQLFAPGVPQVYYVGFLGGENDDAAVRLTGEGRAINRHDYTVDDIDEALATPLVSRIVRLVRFRHGHPAFRGRPTVAATATGVSLVWAADGASATLEVDLPSRRARISARDADGKTERFDA